MFFAVGKTFLTPKMGVAATPISAYSVPCKKKMPSGFYNRKAPVAV